MTRVIVADDDRVTSHLVCSVLRRQGYEAEPARDVEALFVACARAPAPAAILLDLNMPGGSGADSVHRIRHDPALARVPLIVVSGSELSADHAMALDAGATAFIDKPIDIARLLAVLADAIARTPSP